MVGVNPDFLQVDQPAHGRGAVHDGRGFVLPGQRGRTRFQAAEKLFAYGDPVGKTVRVGEDHYFRIIGVTSFKAPSSGTGCSLAAQDFNRDIYIPITTNRARFGEVFRARSRVVHRRADRAVADDGRHGLDGERERTAQALDSMLRQFHPKKDYLITVPLELLEKAEATKRIFNMVLGSIASISLLVGGIGIMNIMLATVSERTREIGIRRALGAAPRHHSPVPDRDHGHVGSGGMIGVILGLSIPPVVSCFSGIPVVISAWSPLVAFLIAVMTGIVFGVYPARRAAMLDPVEALRTSERLGKDRS